MLTLNNLNASIWLNMLRYNGLQFNSFLMGGVKLLKNNGIKS